MTALPAIRVERIVHGTLPAAGRLNPRLSPATPLLVATLDIDWTAADPIRDLHRLENALLVFSPRFRRHQCRGATSYRLFRRRGARREAATFESGLALAHLIEHSTIDFICTITDVRRCSGVTAAHRDRSNRFDLMVECGDPRVGRCGLALAMAWILSALLGSPPGPEETAVLAVARLAYGRNGAGVTAIDVARAMRWPEEKAARALSALRDVSFLSERPWTMSLSGETEYRLAGP